MKVIVLGSGVIGVTTAYRLQQAGHEVTVIDRHDASAAECSFANGGQLSYSHIEPWATPAALKKVPKWLCKKDSPLVLNMRLDMDMFIWTLKFLACCNEKKVAKSTHNMSRLALYSRKCLQEIKSSSKVDFNYSNTGTLHTFKDQSSFEHNIKQSEFQRTLGCDFEILSDRTACEKKEPALKGSPANIIGGIYFPIDASGDVNKFTVSLAENIREQNVEFMYDTKVERLEVTKGCITGVITNRGKYSADAYVVSLGAYSPVVLKGVGINVPIYPMKGYSISIPVINEDMTPLMCVTDQSNKIVLSRLGDVLRVAGTAEFAGYDHTIKSSRINTLKNMTRTLFPESGDFEKATTWSCLRPSTPDGSPVIGKTKYSNLFLNTGHGTLGWTLACGSATIVSDIISGKNPVIDLCGLDMRRYN